MFCLGFFSLFFPSPQVLTNLAVAVVAGTVLSSLAFAWEMSIRVTAPVRLTDSVHGYDEMGGEVGLSTPSPRFFVVSFVSCLLSRAHELAFGCWALCKCWQV